MRGLLNIRLAAMLMATAGIGAFAQPAVRESRRGVGRSNAVPRHSSGNRYPEQSSRQAMRWARRAQGGPGIWLWNGEWIARGISL